MKASNNRFNLIKPFVTLFAEQQCKKRANPSHRCYATPLGPGFKG
jgi:hypothetical protein